MATQVVQMKCKGCAAPIDMNKQRCDFCKQPVAVSTFNSVFEMPLGLVNQCTDVYQQESSAQLGNPQLDSFVAMCYLKLEQHDEAVKAFERAMRTDFNNSENYFYAAVCLLEGKKAFVAQKSTIEKIDKLLKSAIKIEPKGIYYYFWSYIKYDYYERKYFNTSPDYKELLQKATTAGLSPFDIEQLYSILGVQRPELL
jgi:tetratricopeptide (TPR) repeat protein